MTEKEKVEKKTETSKELKAFVEAGVQFGHIKSNVHPGMFPYIFGTRNNIHIIDVTKTKEKLEEVLEVIKELIVNNKTILFVGTKLPVRAAIEKIAQETGMPYITNRWFGGTLTNWETISERIKYLKDLKEKKKTNEWKKYTKHERVDMEKKIKKLEAVFGGIEDMEKLPDAIFIVDIHANKLAAYEARKSSILSIGIADTNVNPKDVDYAIPANDDAVASVELILGKVGEVILKNKKGKLAKKTNIAKAVISSKIGIKKKKDEVKPKTSKK